MSPLTAKAIQSKETVARILEATTRLFVAHGYHGTSIAAIAKATGLTKGALYAHFSSKEDLLLTLIKKFEVEYLDQLISEVNDVSGNGLDKLHYFFNFAAIFSENNRELCLLATIISAEFSGASHDRFDSEFRRLYFKYARFLRRIVEEGKLQGVINPDVDTHTVAYTIIAFHDGVLLQWQRSRDVLEGTVFVKTFRQLLFHGIGIQN
ncbi:MAG: TetR/AcrR family transcriptional regulator [Deltaproteobacteria bacterium]|nr:TetR/AcrR family transcriptional regulator [Deltaproteobacteria bacterium]